MYMHLLIFTPSPLPKTSHITLSLKIHMAIHSTFQLKQTRTFPKIINPIQTILSLFFL